MWVWIFFGGAVVLPFVLFTVALVVDERRRMRDGDGQYGGILEDRE